MQQLDRTSSSIILYSVGLTLAFVGVFGSIMVFADSAEAQKLSYVLLPEDLDRQSNELRRSAMEELEKAAGERSLRLESASLMLTSCAEGSLIAGAPVYAPPLEDASSSSLAADMGMLLVMHSGSGTALVPSGRYLLRKNATGDAIDVLGSKDGVVISVPFPEEEDGTQPALWAKVYLALLRALEPRFQSS